MLHPSHLRCECRSNPLGIDSRQARLSWALTSQERDQAQSAYRILVAGSEDDLDVERGLLWDSGRVESSASSHIPYAGLPLHSGQRAWWKVAAWDGEGRASDYSQAAWWQMGLLEPSDWRARWISFDTGPENELLLKPAPYLRRVFAVPGPVARATLYATAKGFYRLRLNGEPVGADVLAPDWTDFRQRIIYNTYDVTRLLRPGDNALAAILGDGWYCGYVGFQGRRGYYGEQPELLVQLHVELADGSVLIAGTDDTWRGSAGPILYSDMLMGEAYDARREMPGWDRPGFDDRAWRPVSAAAVSERLVAQTAETVQAVRQVPVRRVSQPSRQLQVVDLGQNFAGWVRIRVAGRAGDRVVLHYGEVLNRDGTVYTGNLRKARATDTYIAKGGGEETWEPHFTYHGFRYVQIDTFPNGLKVEVEHGCAVYSGLAEAGTFECSDPLVNRIWQNILWGQRSNFVSVPTDCPQRDERLGWLGDVFAFGPTACFNMDAAAFLRRWLVTIAEAQSPAGAFPDVAPRLVAANDGAAGWGDLGIYLPWVLYRFYGDTQAIAQHYPAMAAWMAYLRAANRGFLRTEQRNADYGDWLSYNAETPRDLIATAFWAYDASLMAEMAGLIGRPEDAAGYRRLYEDIRQAFLDAYVSRDGRIRGDSQTGYVLALHFGLLPGDLAAAAARYLVEDIERRDWHLSTGFLGTPFLLPALAEAGRADVAYRVLLNDTVPGWGHMIKQGATTVWERWDGIGAGGELFDPAQPTFLHPNLGPVAGMNSFNHYGLGAVGEWLYRYIAGISADADGPGFRRIVIKPYVGGGLTEARAAYDSLAGPIASAWRVEDGTLHLSVTIPANTQATVYVPAAGPDAVSEGGRPVAEADGIRVRGYEAGRLVLAAGSGSYAFSAALAERGPAA